MGQFFLCAVDGQFRFGLDVSILRTNKNRTELEAVSRNTFYPPHYDPFDLALFLLCLSIACIRATRKPTRSDHGLAPFPLGDCLRRTPPYTVCIRLHVVCSLFRSLALSLVYSFVSEACRVVCG